MEGDVQEAGWTHLGRSWRRERDRVRALRDARRFVATVIAGVA